MNTKPKEVKIIQIVMTENNYSWQGKILGLGSDGSLYVLEELNGKKWWELYL